MSGVKIYTVSSMSKIDYDFSVEICNHGAFVNKADAIECAKSEFEQIKKDHAGDIIEYSDIEVYTELNGILYMEEDDEYGYYCVSFGAFERYECHSAYVEEWELTE